MIKFLSPEVEAIIDAGWQDAHARRQEYLLYENILFSALGIKIVQEIMIELDVDWKLLRGELDFFLTNEVEHLDKPTRPKRTVMFKNMLQHMLFHTQSSGKISQIEDMLLAMFNEKESTAVFLMNKFGVDDYALKELAVQTRESDDDDESKDDGDSTTSTKRQKKTALEQFATNLTKAAEEGLIDPVIGRDEETERMIQILCRKKKNNPLLLGEAGVGKCLAGNHEITVEVDDALYETIMSIS